MDWKFDNLSRFKQEYKIVPTDYHCNWLYKQKRTSRRKRQNKKFRRKYGFMKTKCTSDKVYRVDDTYLCCPHIYSRLKEQLKCQSI